MLWQHRGANRERTMFLSKVRGSIVEQSGLTFSSGPYWCQYKYWPILDLVILACLGEHTQSYERTSHGLLAPKTFPTFQPFKSQPLVLKRQA